MMNLSLFSFQGAERTLSRRPGFGHAEVSTGYAPLAQLVEHLTLNQGVQGSSP